jgi:hypothetical protein
VEQRAPFEGPGEDVRSTGELEVLEWIIEGEATPSAEICCAIASPIAA